MTSSSPPPCIYVLGGANGAGKSSIGGAAFLQHKVPYFNPDLAARRFLALNPSLRQEEANSAAWFEGKRLLERAIAERLNFALETTLGGNSISGLLEKALAAAIEVRVWYVGLATPELHIARVRACVARGGHDIPEATIRERYHRSRLNLIRLIPRLTELRVFDNSVEADPHTGAAPQPELIVHCHRGKIVECCDLHLAPAWAKPILLAALKTAI